MTADVRVRGGATAEELAVVLALVSRGEVTAPPRSRYETWRAARLAALRTRPAERLSR